MEGVQNKQTKLPITDSPGWTGLDDWGFQTGEQRRAPSLATKDGNGHRIPAYPRISNPAGTDTGDRVHPRARVRAEF